MSQQTWLETALRAADSAIYLESPAQAARAAKAWRRCPVLGLDTEFVRERTYFAELGLVQLSDGQSVWLLDPLAPGTLDPLRALLQDPSVGKILHSPSEDLEVLQHTVGALPDPLIDSQAACALLGQPLQMGYHTAVEWLFGIALEKEQTRSNWGARPLSEAQLHYAALDVCLLPRMWDVLGAQLESKGRTAWLSEDCERQLRKAREQAPGSEMWRRIGGAGRLDGRSLAILQALADWREKTARAMNRPRGFIIPDAVLLAIAEQKLHHAGSLEGLEGLHPNAAKRYARVVAAIVEECLDSGTTLPPLARLTAGQQRLLKRMRHLVQERATELGLEPAVLASRRELEDMLSGPEVTVPERLEGWRMAIIGHDLMAMAGGK